MFLLLASLTFKVPHWMSVRKSTGLLLSLDPGHLRRKSISFCMMSPACCNTLNATSVLKMNLSFSNRAAVEKKKQDKLRKKFVSCSYSLWEERLFEKVYWPNFGSPILNYNNHNNKLFPNDI